MHDCASILERTSTRTGDVVVALAGNPNSGKTTIFNALTGLRQKVGNYPGVTVEKKTGRCRIDADRWATVIDLPGTYSLISRSPDERVATEVLRGLRADTPQPQVVIAVVDASNLQRNLYLVSQLIELGRPLVIALNMTDIAQRRGMNVDAAGLEQALGVPVVPVVGHRRKGIRELAAAIDRAAIAPMPAFELPAAMQAEVDRLASLAGADAERLLIGDQTDDARALAERADIAPLLAESMARLRDLGIDPMQADIEAHYRWIDSITEQAIPSGTGFQPVHVNEEHGVKARATLLNYESAAKSLTERADAILIHKVWGLLIFAGIMGLLFYSLFFIADPIMGAVEAGVAWLGGLVTGYLPEGPIQDLWADGIVAGVGAVVVFVPQIALLFLFLAILEDTGYLARAAFLMDRLLRGVGLHGKSFIPLLSSFACAIPGIMATRTIEDRRDRLATIFVAPFMSCSARLPVYILLIGTFFAGWSAWGQAGIMLGLYALGIVAAAGTAWVFKRSLLKGRTSSFILELPVYKIPQVSQIGRTVWTNSKAFVVRAGTIIFCLSVILWAMAYYPRLPEERADSIRQPVQEAIDDVRARGATGMYMEWHRDEDRLVAWLEQLTTEAIASAQLEHSISGRIGHAMEPVIRPLGYDWKMGVGLVAAFAAREVFVSQMAIVYSAGDAEESTTSLQFAMRSDTYPDGSPVWTTPVAASLLVWFVLAMQCMSTLAIVRRETGGWKWPFLMVVYMNVLAYAAALMTYQIGTRLV